MKKLVFLLLFITIIGCEKTNTSPEGTKYFNPEKLTRLNLANIDNYWNEGLAIDTSYYMGASFENHDGFIGGIKLYSGNGKAIWVSVFNTKEEAIDAMESRINSVACVINEGNEDEFETKWWYSECLDYFVFVNQYNTIIEIDFSSNAPFDLIKTILLDVATEINERIDTLSDYC